MFGKKKSAPGGYDREHFEPVIRCSICTGEQSAGFLEKQTGTFHGVMLLRDARDLEAFRREYGIVDSVRKIY